VDIGGHMWTYVDIYNNTYKEHGAVNELRLFFYEKENMKGILSRNEWWIGVCLVLFRCFFRFQGGR